jgi:tetratricopeptide (TPR) repeat protein
MDERQLLERYEALGDERDYVKGRELYERALAHGRDATTILQYGCLLECHGRNELRRAVALYRQACALDPNADKPVWQLIGAYAGLREPEQAVAFCEQNFTTPRSLRGQRFLASAYLAAGEHEQAQAAIDAGLALAPDDARLIATRGELKAATGDADGALADWQRALELDPDDIGALYSTAFLLERNGRLADAAGAWRSIITWNETRGFTLDTEWPRRELDRIHELKGEG